MLDIYIIKPTRYWISVFRDGSLDILFRDSYDREAEQLRSKISGTFIIELDKITYNRIHLGSDFILTKKLTIEIV